jgi:hypothetical protein
MAAHPIGAPGWPELAACTMSTLRHLIALTQIDSVRMSTFVFGDLTGEWDPSATAVIIFLTTECHEDLNFHGNFHNLYERTLIRTIHRIGMNG